MVRQVGHLYNKKLKPEPKGATDMRIVLGGDTMLGRLVKAQILAKGIDYPLGEIRTLFQRADLRIINLECAITTYPHHWSGAEKAFYFGAPPEAVDILTDLKIDLVSVANNHMLDFDVSGLKDTLYYLDTHNIHYAGAGSNASMAFRPAILDCQGVKFGMVAFCDHQADFAATARSPGIAYLDLKDTVSALQQFQTSLQQMQAAGVEWPILSLHWGPNQCDRPSEAFKMLAHQAIDMGYQLLFGHSAHVFHGIEIYKGCPIIYAAGDLVDDYAVGDYFRNDHQLVFELLLEEKKLKKILLYPIFIHDFKTSFAEGRAFDYIAERMTRLSGEMGTQVKTYDARSLQLLL